MVLIHFKKSDHNQFLFDTVTSIPTDELLKQLIEINNLRLKIDRLAMALEDLAAKGP